LNPRNLPGFQELKKRPTPLILPWGKLMNDKLDERKTGVPDERRDRTLDPDHSVTLSTAVRKYGEVFFEDADERWQGQSGLAGFRSPSAFARRPSLMLSACIGVRQRPIRYVTVFMESCT
jgi:hypothetical protein